MRFGLGKHANKTNAEFWKAGDSMVSSNKILTVSYGTFSCTLEGFDNSFDTMKAIAEYFRDLAQDDRYFGAEPPTPDAEMLARIAEREIERRVEARFEKGNLVLRPTDDAETPHGDVAPKSSMDAALMGATAGAAATALAVADPQDTGLDLTLDQSEDSSAALDDMTVDEQAHEAEDVDLDLDDSSVDLSNVDLSLADADDITVSADDVLDYEDDAPADSSIDDLIAEQGVKANLQAEADIQEARDAAEQAEAEIVAEGAPAASDSVADKLQRIRAVVAAKSQAVPEYIEDEHAMSGPDGDGIDENDAIDADEGASLEDNLFADTIAAVVADQVDAEDDADEFFLSDVSDDEEQFEIPTAPEADASDDTQSELEALRAKVAELEALSAANQAADISDVKATEDDIEDDEDDLDFLGQDEEDEDDLELFAEDDGEEDDVAAETADAPLMLSEELAVDEEDAPEPIVAHVGKAKRADVDAALASGDIEEYDDEDEDDATFVAASPVPGLEDSSLTPEQEAELARELADLHAEIERDSDWNFEDEDDDDLDAFEDTPVLSEADELAANASIRKAVKLTSPARAMLTDTSIEEDDDSVGRLADKTETEMDEPEGNRRRSAIAHLRAAVAATKADRILGLGKKAVDEEVPYREDLADAVRPRRPKITEARSERPAPVRSAPLKLVAEQRIDVDADNGTSPVRPRRVVRSAEAVDTADTMTGNDTGFAEFAENQGAHTLPELLEAAASYMSFVEGRDQFSRPQLMTKLHQAEGEASSREERLRSFGQLLREGKIEKKGGGRFAASESIGFKPDERAAG